MRSAESRDDEELLSSSSKRCCVGLPPAVGVGLFSAVGGLLFGLDIGYIAGVEAMASFRADVNGGRPLGDWTAGTVTGAFAVGAVAASNPLASGALVGAVGQKHAIVVGAAVFCAGALLQGLARGLGVMIAGRFVGGLAIGTLSTHVPVYQGEVAPPAMRGTLVTLYQLAITAGIAAGV